MRTIKPMGSKVILKKLEYPTKSEGGILIPDYAQETKAWRCEVLAVGPGKKMQNGVVVPVGVKVGDVVVLNNYSRMELTVDGEDVLTMDGMDILAVEEGV